MSRKKAKNRLSPDKIYTLDEIKSIVQNKPVVSPYIYRHIILQLLDEEKRTTMLHKSSNVFHQKPEDFVTY